MGKPCLRLALACAATVLAGGCAAIEGPRQTLTSEGPVVPRVVSSESLIETPADRFGYDQRESIRNPTNPERAGLYFMSGLRLARGRCMDYFRDLGMERRRLSAFQRGAALAGAGVATIGGLADLSTRVIAITGAALTAAVGASEIYGDLYLYAPDIAAVRELVERAQDTFEEELPKVDPTVPDRMNYFTATTYIRDYQNICQIENIRRLVTDAVARAQLRGPSTDNETALLDQAELLLAPRLAAIMGTDIDPERLTLMYWWATSSDTDLTPKNRKRFVDRFGAARNNPFKLDGGAYKSALSAADGQRLRARLNTEVFGGVLPALRARWQQRIDAWRAADSRPDQQATPPVVTQQDARGGATPGIPAAPLVMPRRMSVQVR